MQRAYNATRTRRSLKSAQRTASTSVRHSLMRAAMLHSLVSVMPAPQPSFALRKGRRPNPRQPKSVRNSRSTPYFLIDSALQLEIAAIATKQREGHVSNR